MFTAAALGQVGPWGLVALFVLLIGFGYLIPRWMHSQRIKDKENQIEKLTKALDHRDDQFDTLTSQWETIIKLLEDLKRQADRREAESRHPT